jgi:hypothetical protein
MMLEMGMELPSEEDGWDDETRDDVTEGDRAFVKFLRGLVDAEAEMEAAGECSGDAEDGMKAAMRAVERLDPKPEVVAWASELVKAVSFIVLYSSKTSLNSVVSIFVENSSKASSHIANNGSKTFITSWPHCGPDWKFQKRRSRRLSNGTKAARKSLFWQ